MKNFHKFRNKCPLFYKLSNQPYFIDLNLNKDFTNTGRYHFVKVFHKILFFLNDGFPKPSPYIASFICLTDNNLVVKYR